jgi:P27 family predicted phage terminase small subunit
MNPPKSTDKLKQDGTFRADRHGGRIEEKVRLLEMIPEAPSGFDKRHRNKWSEVCQKVYDLGVLCENDLDSLETYVKYWFIGKDAYAEIQKNGLTIITEKSVSRNPAILTMNEATKICQQISDKFAGNPRSRMVIKTGKQDAGKEDPLDNLN